MSEFDTGAKAHIGQAQFDHSAQRRMHEEALGQARQVMGQEDHAQSWLIATMGRVVGILLRWLTFLAVIWSYRFWEPIVCRGMGRRYYAVRHVFIALVVFVVFPMFWLFLAPALVFVVSGIPLVGQVMQPFAHVAPDVGAFLGHKDAVAQVQRAYDTPVGSAVPVVRSDRRVPPSLQQVYGINLLSDPWVLNFAKQIKAQGKRASVNQETALLARKAVIFVKSFGETVFYFIPFDIAVYLIMFGIYVICVVRHFRAAGMVEDSKYEGVMINSNKERENAGKNAVWEEWFVIPLILAIAGFALALCGLSLVAVFLLCSGISLAFFRGRLVAKDAALAHDKVDQPAASARAQAAKEAAEKIRLETMASIQKRILAESGKEGSITEDGVEIARSIAPQMADDGAKEFIRATLEKLAQSDNPAARSAAKKILAAQSPESKLRDSGDYEGVGVS